MLFNSIEFAIFLPVVYLLYWCILNNQLKKQNVLLLISSYFFYAFWDWRFLFLLIFSTLLDYYTGLKMSTARESNVKKFWLYLSISINLGFLAIFKYYNFFANSLMELSSHLGLQFNLWTLKIILPVGISFYTFHGLSYVIDIYNNRIKAEKNFIDYSLFVSFFPLLVAGPIERATHLLPQIQQKRSFDLNKMVDGLRQILWGLFKKVVIADQCAKYANIIFNDSSNYSGSTLVIGAILFSFQIYGDFSGYSDVALGTARLFGIELLRNFAFPYFSRDIAEFWRRWHISLSTWFRDYLYIPLGGSKGGFGMKVRNTFMIFIVSGFWHGANWTFIFWGALNAIYFLPLLIRKNNRNNLDTVASGKYLPSLRELTAMLSTFFLTAFAWIFFRAESIEHAFNYVSKIFSASILSIPYIIEPVSGLHIFPKSIFIFIALFLVIEWVGREQLYAIERLGIKWKRPVRYAMYYGILIAIYWYGGEEQQFIYFQF